MTQHYRVHMISYRMQDLAIVIPAYNESQTIADVVKNASAYGRVIVVNDNSSDQTASIAEKAGAVVVSHEKNRGYDGALDSGFKKAAELGDVKYVITLDADGQHDPKLIQRFRDLFGEGNRMVVGRRPKPARAAEWVFAKYANLFYGIHDPLCGMKGYDISLYRQLGHFDSYQSIGTELMFYGLKNKVQFVEIDVPIRDRIDQPRFGQAFRANMKIMKALLKSV